MSMPLDLLGSRCRPHRAEPIRRAGLSVGEQEGLYRLYCKAMPMLVRWRLPPQP